MLKMIGNGSFGSVFKAINKKTKENVAIKVEDWKKTGNILENEAYILFYLKNYGIPEIKSFGTYKKYKVLVQTLLGENLGNIFVNKTANFNCKDICMIAIQLLDRLEYVHSKYIIHRDLKPENIMLDLVTKKIVYLIDFGMAKKYRSNTTKRHIKFAILNRFTGTARYCSINALRGTEQSRRDDLESAGYVLIYLAKRGYLPWMGLNIHDKDEKFRKVYQIKKETKEEVLCQSLPNEFCQYIKYVKKLNFEEEPNYNYLRGLFKELLIKIECQNDLKFSWNPKNRKSPKEDKNFINQRNNNFYRRKSPFGRIIKDIENSHEKEKKMYNLNQEKLSLIIEEAQEKREKEIIENIKKQDNLESSSNKRCSNNSRDTPSFSPIKNDKYSKNETNNTKYNIPINIEDSDEIKNINENKNDNINNNLNNFIKGEIKNIYKNNSSAKLNILKKNKIYTDGGGLEEKEEKNDFNFLNNSFKGTEHTEQNNKPENNNNKININNNINSIKDDIIIVKNKEINNKIDNKETNSVPKKENNNLSKGKNIKKILKENKNKKEPIINNNIKTNLNKGKIIKITRDANYKQYNTKNHLQIKILKHNQNNLNKIYNKATPEKQNNSKIIKLNNNNYNCNNYFTDIKSGNFNLSYDENNNSLKTNKSGKTINSMNLNKKPNNNRSPINFNQKNIRKSNSAAGLDKNNKVRGIKNENYNKLLNYNSTKKINIKNNNQKMNFPKSVSPINTIEKSKKNSSPSLFKEERLIKNKNQKTNNRINKIQKIKPFIFSRNKRNKNTIKLNLSPINKVHNPQFNNNVIKNLNYTINCFKTGLYKNNNKKFDNKRNNDNLVINQYNDKRKSPLQYKKYKDDECY